MNIHTLTLHGYEAEYPDAPNALYLGTAGSYGQEALCIVPGTGWLALDIVAVFHPPGKTPLSVRVPASSVVDVPPEMTAIPGRGQLVLCGYADGVQLLTVNIPTKVLPTAGGQGDPPADLTPSLTQQILAAADNADGQRRHRCHQTAQSWYDCPRQSRVYGDRQKHHGKNYRRHQAGLRLGRNVVLGGVNV